MLKDDEKPNSEAGASRREFLGKALAAGAGLALGSNLPLGNPTVDAQSAPSCAQTGEKLMTIGEIKKPAGSTGPVQGVIKVLNERKAYLAKSSASGNPPVCQYGEMRYFASSLPNGSQMWPTTHGLPTPGPTIRARVGDTVEITLLNQVDVQQFANSRDTGVKPLDQGDEGYGCDVATTTGPSGSSNTYPGNPPFDTMPDCFHGSSTANLHYHGTHVSPNIIEDNVFVQLRPSPRINGQPVVNEKYLADHDFGQIFTNCQAGHSPTRWQDLPQKWQNAQHDLLTQYDKTAVWQGKTGGTPPEEQLWHKDSVDIAAGRWPQHYIGAYPSCFKLPPWNGQPNSMGQAPGTHWYHAHKHGSTALNLSNGMAGAFIIQGDYDDKLRPFYNKEVVLVLQQYGVQVNLLRAVGTTASDLVSVNGQFTPVLDMQPGEVQLWRIVNACHQAAVPLNGPPASSGLKWIQTAQDGVQLHPDNYNLALQAAQSGGTWTNATLTTPMTSPPWFGNLAPGNRVDLLVQAPASGSIPIQFGSNNTLLFTVMVTGNPISNPIAFPPPQSSFPPMPGFLNDLNPNVVIHRELHFKTTPGTGRNSSGAAPDQTINGKKFQDHIFDQTMQLGDTEEWTIYNDGGPAHPFHIHINPFQIIEIKTAAGATFKLPTPWIWWDNIALPQGGYIKFLSRFADFTGAYVLHCHILGHEDRGMMEMVRVIDPSTTIGHH
jgi:FtsP/CotA-like multicopper oxidase with cupredoxin domain